jgi:hypothetical protein
MGAASGHRNPDPNGALKMATKKRYPVWTPSTTIGVRCHPNLLLLIDAYRRDEPDLPTRASAIRRLAIIGLKAIKYAKSEYQLPSPPDAHADKRQSKRGRIGKNNQ